MSIIKWKSNKTYRRETEGARPVDVVAESKSAVLFANGVEAKGFDDITLDHNGEDVLVLGYQGGEITTKGNLKPSATAAQENLMNRHNEGSRVPENRPVGESNGKGIVERSIQGSHGQRRTIQVNSETKTGKMIGG